MLMTAGLPAHDPRVQARRVISQALGFSDCSPDVLDQLVAAGQLKRVARGEHLVRRGDLPDSVGLVVSGLLEASALRADGHRHFAGLVVPGDFCCVFNFVDGLPHPHDIVAREPTTLLMIANQALQPVRAQHPSVVLACEQHLARRLRFMFERLYADPGLPLESRVASMLTMVGRLYGHAVGPHIELDFKLSQTDLADWLGLSRQRVNFALKQLESERLIRLHYSILTITNPVGLEARAESGQGSTGSAG